MNMSLCAQLAAATVEILFVPRTKNIARGPCSQGFISNTTAYFPCHTPVLFWCSANSNFNYHNRIVMFYGLGMEIYY